MAGDVRQLHTDARLSRVSVEYRNPEMIWRQVMPVTIVGKRSNLYSIYDKSNTYDTPDDAVFPNAKPNEIQMKVSTDNYSVADHAYGHWVAQEEVDNADAPLRPLMAANRFLNARLDLAQEYRVAQVIFATGSYPSSNVTTLAGNTQWTSDSADPIGNIQTAINQCLMKANTLVFGQEAWLALRRHPKALGAVKGFNVRTPSSVAASMGGLATMSEIASLFEVDRVLVGGCRRNTANQGQTASISYVWGKSMAALHVAPGAMLAPNTITFATTFMESDRTAYRDFDGKMGLKGSHYLKVGWNSDQKIVAQDLGAMLATVIA